MHLTFNGNLNFFSKGQKVRTKDNTSKTSTTVGRKEKTKPNQETIDTENKILALFESDSEGDDFEGFSAEEIAQSERRMEEIIQRNEALLRDLEAGSFDLELDEEGIENCCLL